MVLLAAVFFLLCLVVGIVLLVIEGLRFWRVLKRSMGKTAQEMGVIAAGGEAAGRAAEGLDLRRQQLADAQTDLARQAAAAAKLGQAAATGAVLINWPLRFLMGR